MRTNILGINNEAEEAIKSLNFYDQNESNLLTVDEEADEASPTKEKKDTLKDKLYQIEPIEKEDEDDFAMQIQAGFKGSQEAQKTHIYSTLEEMHNNMKNFQRDIESKLDMAY